MNYEHEGILESEDLSKLTISDASFFFINGPNKVKGQDQFTNIYVFKDFD